MENRPLSQRLLALASACAVIWVFAYVAGPMLVNASQDFRKLGDFIVREDIDTGKFYYTDLELVGHADHNARSTMEYMPTGPGPLPAGDGAGQ